MLSSLELIDLASQGPLALRCSLRQADDNPAARLTRNDLCKQRDTAHCARDLFRLGAAPFGSTVKSGTFIEHRRSDGADTTICQNAMTTEKVVQQSDAAAAARVSLFARRYGNQMVSTVMCAQRRSHSQREGRQAASTETNQKRAEN